MAIPVVTGATIMCTMGMGTGTVTATAQAVVTYEGKMAATTTATIEPTLCQMPSLAVELDHSPARRAAKEPVM